ncbi:MAG: hypothetical protein ACTSPI_07455, partial [Candidatus Heimdallarchaeaceae archaeon]
MQELHFDPKINDVIEKVLKENLFLQKGENFLIATDYPSALDLKYRESEVLERIFNRNFLAKHIQKIAKERFSEVKTDLYAFPCQWVHYPEEIPNLLEKVSNYDVAYILTEFSISNIFWLQQKGRNLQTRIAFSPTCDETIFFPQGPLDIDNQQLEKEVMQTYAKFKNAKEVRLWNHIGTELVINLENSQLYYESGILDYPRKRANLPAGEVSVREMEVNGKFVIPAGWIEGLTGNLKLK